MNMALIKKILSLSLICLMVSQSVILLGMESELNNDSGEILRGFVSIDYSHLIYSSPQKNDTFKDIQIDFLEKTFDVKLEDKDPLVRVWVKSEASSDWSYTGLIELRKLHPDYEKCMKLYSKCKTYISEENLRLRNWFLRIGQERRFPSYFPLSFFQSNKKSLLKAGNTLQLSVHGKKVEFTLARQLPSYRDPQNQPESGLKKITRLFFKQSNQPDKFEAELKHLMDIFAKCPNYVMYDQEELVKKGILVKEGDTCKHGPKGFRNADEENNDAN